MLLALERSMAAMSHINLVDCNFLRMAQDWARRNGGPDAQINYEALKNLVTAGASRVGASAGVKIVQESKGGAKSSPSVQSGY